MAFVAAEGPYAGKVEVAGKIIEDREKAILFDDGGGARWLAKSQIDFDVERDGTVIVWMPKWLAMEKKFV